MIKYDLQIRFIFNATSLPEKKKNTFFEIVLLFLSPLKLLQNELHYFHNIWCEYYVPGTNNINNQLDATMTVY